MKFEEIKKRVESRKLTKIYVVESGQSEPFLFTGYVTAANPGTEEYFADVVLYPYVGLNVRNACHGLGLFGEPLDRGKDFRLDIADEPWQQVSQLYKTHEWQSKALVRKVCGENNEESEEALESYLQFAGEL